MATLSATTANRSQMSEFIKVNYSEAITDIFHNSSAFMKTMKSKKNFTSTEKAGGRVLEFPYELKGPENTGMRTRGDALPGFSGVSGDTLDTYDGQTASVDRARIYNAIPFDGEWLTSSNKKFLFDKAHQFSKHMKDAVQSMTRDAVIQLFGDGTGILGTVASVSTTTATLKPASTIDVRGRNGNVVFRPNQKVEFIQAAHWASSARASKIDSALGIQKVASVSKIGDVGASPTVTFENNIASAGVDVGDVIVINGSRSKASGGAASGGTLYTFQGMQGMVDDGTLTSDLYGITRASYGALNAPTSLSSVARIPTWQLFQGLVTQLERRAMAEELKNLVILSEMSVRNNFVSNDATGLKRYVQEGKALTHLAGFDDVQMVFLGANRPMPWICDRDYPYGHAHIINLDDIYGMWDKEPGVLDHDDKTLRNYEGYDTWYVAFAGYGNFVMEKPFNSARISGLQGLF